MAPSRIELTTLGLSRPILKPLKLSYPKPSISLSPSGGVSLGGAVTVRCWGQHQGVQFVLNKERRHFPPADLDGSEAVFSSSNVHQDLGGSYSCSYHSRSEPFAVSYPSDPVELVVRGEGPASASPFPAPPPNVTIRCQGQRRDVRFFLHKAGDLNPQQHVDPAGDGAEFRITTVSRQHGGNYSCSYRPQSEPFISSQPSDTIELVVAGEGPGSTSPLPYQLLGMTFLLYKAGDVEYLNYTDPAGSEAEFPITSARREHGGNYTCRYHNKSGIYSEHSDRVQIIVAGEGPSPESRLPASHPARAQGVSVSPGAQVMALGENITIRCEGLYSGTEFFLRKAGHPNLQVRTVPDGTVAEFPITSVGRKDGGNYTCDYHSIMDQNRSSYPSDPVRIIVGGEGGARLSVLAPSPTPSQTHRESDSWPPSSLLSPLDPTTPLEPGTEPRSPGSQTSQQRSQGVTGPWTLVWPVTR
uniref:Immunoglobulin domain-containing protein n=1 Tax=Terrapene triunguis TaxID=2587831 RepID=A0A674IDQ5_9SAUR